jgi:hypothetical protein
MVYPAVLQAVFVMTCVPGQAADPAAETLKDLNAVRKAAGLRPVVLDPKLSKACLAHAEYLAKNFDPAKVKEFNPHVESPRLPGYSQAGAKAARASEVQMGYGQRGNPKVIAGYMDCFFHRIRLIRPDLERIGFGHTTFRGDWFVVVLDAKTGRAAGRGKFQKPVLYPPDEGTGIPLAFSENEIPNPIPPEGRGERAGFPITVSFPVADKVTRVTASLKDGKNKPVAVWLSTPEKPANKPGIQHNSICLIPKEKLLPNTTYKVTVTAAVAGRRWRQAWSFTTAEE